MTDINREAFEAWQKERHRLGTYHSNLEAWQAGAAHYEPKLTEQEAVESLARFFALQEYHAHGFETLGSPETYINNAYKDHLANARNSITALRAAGVRFREEA
jgi:hypothetical protein